MLSTRRKGCFWFSLWANKQWIKEHQNKVPIKQNIWGEKLLCFEWEMAIHGKTFIVGFLYTYNADRQKQCFVGKDSQLSEKWWKLWKLSP